MTWELQSQLLDITFTFSENLDSWQHVWCHSGLLVENDTFLLLGGQLAIEDPEHWTFPTGALHQTPPEKPPLGLVQRLSCCLQKHLLGLLGQ